MPDAALTIAVDGRCLNTDHVRGMGKCLFELIRRAPSSVRWRLLGDREDSPMHAPGGANVSTERFDMRGYRLHLWEQIGLPRRVRQLRPDILYGPAMRLPLWQPAPSVVTVHDAMPWVLDEPEWPPGVYRDRLVPAAFRRAAAIVTDSESSAADLIRLWPQIAGTLHTIPLGVGEQYFRPHAGPTNILRQLGVSGPYLLYLGGDIPRKRLHWALRVWRAAPGATTLVACGVDKRQHDAIRAALTDVPQERLVFAPFVSEDDLPDLYSQAVAVLYPSTYEGFGLPALEAQAVGTPVLFSDVPGLRELSGPGARVLPPEDLGAWVAVLSALISARGDSPRPDEAAREWAKGFSWNAYADRMLALFERVRADSVALRK